MAGKRGDSMDNKLRDRMGKGETLELDPTETQGDHEGTNPQQQSEKSPKSKGLDADSHESTTTILAHGQQNTIAHQSEISTPTSPRASSISRSLQSSMVYTSESSTVPIAGDEDSRATTPSITANAVEDLKSYSITKSKFIEEASFDLDLFWEGDDGLEEIQTVVPITPRNNAPALGYAPPQRAGLTEAEIDAKAWLDAEEAKEKAMLRALGPVKMTEESIRLQEHVKALKNAGLQKV
jgi:hypothetical protein